MAFSKYTFIIGKKEDSDKRIYSGTLLSPMSGFKLGMRVAKMISTVLMNAKITDDLDSLLNIEDSDKMDNSDMVKKGLKFIVQCLEYIDVDGYMGLVNEILENTPIYARVDKKDLGGKPSQESVLLSNESSINKWFGEYPQDLLLFSANILFKNSSPFLPEELKTEIPSLLKQIA